MKKQISYNAVEAISAETADDPYQRPAFSTGNKLRRLIWNLCWALFFRLSPRPLHAWRALLLRLFGAELGENCKFYPGARIWAPWNLICEDVVAVADGAEIYNPAVMRFGSHAIVSQGAYLCGATHDFNDVRFPLIAYEMSFGPYSWVCARACVGPGVSLGEGAVLGLAAVATRDLEPWGVYGGSPAVKLKERTVNRAS
jgi:putative colanic acid biosynthesis acetyltransferase WcaF